MQFPCFEVLRTTLRGSLKQGFLPTSMETSRSDELEAHPECCCWTDWGGVQRGEGGETGSGCWVHWDELKSRLEEGGGLSKWSERGSSLMPLSQGDEAHRGELDPDAHSNTFSKESRKWSASSALWDSSCRNVHVHTKHMVTTDTQK